MTEVINCYTNTGGPGNKILAAFAEGCGAELIPADDGLQPGISIIWGILRNSDKLVRESQKLGQTFYFIDHAYIKRGHINQNFRITKNRFQAGEVIKRPDDRWKMFEGVIKPWKENGQQIVVCPPTDFVMEFAGLHRWLDDTLSILKEHTDRQIVVRSKPGKREKIKPFIEELRTAHAVVTYNSNVAIEAVLEGVPVFVNPISAALPVGLSDLTKIESPIYSDREEWCYHLAYSQFSVEEMENGTAWSILSEK